MVLRLPRAHSPRWPQIIVGREDLKQFVLGPVGFFTVSADADPSAAVKALLDYAARNRIEKILRVKGGVLVPNPLRLPISLFCLNYRLRTSFAHALSDC